MSIGFKEWALVCEALGAGRQSIILRKGGIAEGREGFRFKNRAFFLFPTFFHEQLAKTKLPATTPIPVQEPGIIGIRYFVRLEWTVLIENPAILPKLDPFHIWTEEVIQERFHSDVTQGVNLAFVRVFNIKPFWNFFDDPKYGGCRSWVDLPELPGGSMVESVLDDTTHAARQKELREVLGQDNAV